MNNRAPVQTVQELNRFPHTEIGMCLRCSEHYSLTQLRLPADNRDGYVIAGQTNRFLGPTQR